MGSRLGRKRRVRSVTRHHMSPSVAHPAAAAAGFPPLEGRARGAANTPRRILSGDSARGHGQDFKPAPAQWSTWRQRPARVPRLPAQWENRWLQVAAVETAL